MAGFDPRIDYDTAFLFDSSRLYDGFHYYGDNPGPWKVELSFDLSANGVGDWFTLDDVVKGLLDNVTYVLAGDIFTDVTRWVRSIQVRRGRSRQLEKFVAGQCEIVFDNRDRIYDPTMEGSPFYGSIVPRKQVRITYDGYPVWAGNTQDWDFDYDVRKNDATAIMKGLDGFSYMATQLVAAQTFTAQLSGARVNAVLTQLGWPLAQRDIDSGTASVAADTVASGGTNALGYLQKVETSQNGLFFMNSEGLIRFVANADGNPTGFIVSQDAIGMVDYEVVYGAEELYNKVNINYYSGSVAATITANDTISQGKYGVFEATYDTLLSGSVQSASLATALVTKYSEPRYRINKVVFDIRGLDSAAKTQVLSMEMGDSITVEYTPSNVGAPLDRVCLIDAIEHQASAAPLRHTVTLALTDLGAA